MTQDLPNAGATATMEVADVGGWLVFAAVLVPLVVIALFVLFDNSLARIMPGELGLVLVNGTPSGRTLRPGLRFVPTVRRMAVQVYPAFELSYRAGTLDDAVTADGLEHHGPAVGATLGDRAAVTVSYTVRFSIDPEQLTLVHQRYGPMGLFSVVRDASTEVVRAELNRPEVGVADMFGDRREALATHLAEAMAERLAGDGFIVSLVSINDLDLGRTGESVQAAVRAGWDLQREQAEGDLRRQRARTDAELAPLIDSTAHELALRYREADAWRELAQAYVTRTGRLAPTGIGRPSASSPLASAAQSEPMVTPDPDRTEP